MFSTYLVKYYEKNIKYPPKKWNTIDNTIPVLLNPKYFNKDGKISKIIMNIPMTSYKIVITINASIYYFIGFFIVLFLYVLDFEMPKSFPTE